MLLPPDKSQVSRRRSKSGFSRGHGWVLNRGQVSGWGSCSGFEMRVNDRFKDGGSRSSFRIEVGVKIRFWDKGTGSEFRTRVKVRNGFWDGRTWGSGFGTGVDVRFWDHIDLDIDTQTQPRL
ncbi:hypothetical protein TIFTF001_009774 [Ficus carica]|uniref:Uncharacterized protein n=1 Tax=Ficus carica TaxID=3494 RepID=A0AA87ZV92_FICCA|nr:hypothetical protein TIFTF001_009774 [Ficus carica]